MPAAQAISSDLAESGALTVCLALLGAPAASLDRNGKPVGYNAAFAAEIAQRLDLKLSVDQVNFADIPDLLDAGKCDLSVSSQTITQDRLVHMQLIPYTRSSQGRPVVVANGNPLQISSLADLCGKDVSAASGTTNVDLVNGTGDFSGISLDGACQTTGQPMIDLRTYPSELDAAQALLSGTVVAYLGNPNFVNDYPEELELSAATLPPATQGIAVALDHPALGTAVAAALGEMISDGTYLEILGEHVPSQSVSSFSIIE